MTTPAQEAPLVFPSVALRPLLLLAISAVLGAFAVLASAVLGHVAFGWYFVGGLVLGLLNAVLVQRSVQAITADAHPLKRMMALNSVARLMIMSVIGLTIAYLFGPAGLGVVFGMAVFQVLLVLITMAPVVRAVRSSNNVARTARSDD
jgi:hypothetical protein